MDEKTRAALESVAVHNANQDRLALGARAVGILGPANGADILLALASVARAGFSTVEGMTDEQRVDHVVALVVDVVREMTVANRE